MDWNWGHSITPTTAAEYLREANRTAGACSRRDGQAWGGSTARPSSRRSASTGVGRVGGTPGLLTPPRAGQEMGPCKFSFGKVT